MAFDVELLQMMPSLIQLKKLVSRNRYGEPTYGATTSWRAYIAAKRQTIRNAEGQDIVSNSVVYIGGAPVITTDDQLVLPDGSTPPIIGVDLFYDDKAEYATVLYT